MTATTGFSAGPQTNDVVFSYASEAAWGTLPAVQFQAIRVTGDTLAGKKKRDRPSELGTYQAADAVTTEESADGALNYALSYGTFDDFFASALNNDWQAAQTINSITTDLTITTATNVLTSTLAGKFTNLSVGQYIRMIGWVNGANNVIARIILKTSAQNITLSAPAVAFVTETSAAGNAKIRASVIQNANLFKSLYIQKALSATLYTRYAGAKVTGFILSGGVGQYLSGSFQVAAKDEQKSTSNASTGAVLAAPTGRVHDPVTNFSGVYRNNSLVSGTVDSFTINVTSEGAAPQYGMGSASAVGMLQGKFMASGTLKMFFADFTLYDTFKNEASAPIAIVTRDASGNAYAFTFTKANLLNPQIVAGGPNQSVMATFDIEGNPHDGVDLTTTAGTFSIDRMPPT